MENQVESLGSIEQRYEKALGPTTKRKLASLLFRTAMSHCMIDEPELFTDYAKSLAAKIRMNTKNHAAAKGKKVTQARYKSTSPINPPKKYGSK